MTKVGDRVQVTIGAPVVLSGTATLEEGKMKLSGTIVEDAGPEWIVRLDTSFDGRNLVRVPKSAFVGA